LFHKFLISEKKSHTQRAFQTASTGKQPVDPKTPDSCSLTNLLQEISGYNTTSSRFFPNLDLEQLFSEVSDCRAVKRNNRRQIYCLQTPKGGYYLKLSTLIRTKDRLRHFLLPTRRWAEWRNLHRLLAAKIPAAVPVMKGEKRGLQPKAFYLITEKITGIVLKYDSPEAAEKLGRFIARLHSRGVYHADLHPNNIIIRSDDELSLIDTQEVYFLPWLPRHWRIHNLGRLFYLLGDNTGAAGPCDEFLRGYNRGGKKPITAPELRRAVEKYEQHRLRSRTKRCCKNSTEFEILKSSDLRGYRRRDFMWDAPQVRRALQQATIIKPEHVLRFQSVCFKRHRRKKFHQERCLTSWKMSQALTVRGISAPRALAYYKIDRDRLFLSEFLVGGMSLNDYLSALSDTRQKRSALKKLAGWLRKINSRNVWQRDFKSSNVLCREGEYYLLDLEGVKIRRLSHANRIVNLAQLNASLSNAITLKDRLRFFHFYAVDEKLSRDQRRAIYEKVWEISKTKSTKQYDLDLDALVKSQKPPLL